MGKRESLSMWKKNQGRSDRVRIFSFPLKQKENWHLLASPPLPVNCSTEAYHQMRYSTSSFLTLPCFPLSRYRTVAGSDGNAAPVRGMGQMQRLSPCSFKARNLTMRKVTVFGRVGWERRFSAWRKFLLLWRVGWVSLGPSVLGWRGHVITHLVPGRIARTLKAWDFLQLFFNRKDFRGLCLALWRPLSLHLELYTSWDGWVESRERSSTFAGISPVRSVPDVGRRY